MTLPRSGQNQQAALSGADTIVSYPRGDTASTGVVLHVEELPGGGRWAVLLDTSCAHPVDAGWPDQGPDRATLQLAEGSRTVLDCVVAASDGEALHLGADIPVRPGTPGWAFVVAHIVDDPSGITEGSQLDVVVDEAHRRALSHGHTGCHLASLALNRALAGRWAGEPRSDGLGSPDFDAVAIASSQIGEFGSVDRYRLNKSLRRKGFSAEGLAEALPQLSCDINATLAAWIATAAPVRVDADGPRLTDRRSWVCELPEATVLIPCGGTHASSLAELGTAEVALELADVDGTAVLTVTTTLSAV